jgi:hypothetical protein
MQFNDTTESTVAIKTEELKAQAKEVGVDLMQAAKREAQERPLSTLLLLALTITSN